MQHSKLIMNLRFVSKYCLFIIDVCMYRDKHGVTAYQMAKTRGYTGILKLFAKQGLILQVSYVIVLAI